MNFAELKKITEGEIVQFSEDRKVESLITDSRKAFIHENSLFIALKGARHDGHKYIDDLYSKGIRQFLIEEKSNIVVSQFPGANIIAVENSLSALQKIVAAHRAQYNLEVIGITGSNGKTIVKEWLSQLLFNKFNIVKSPKSFNSQLGVPLSVWEMDAKHQLGIFEAGISKVGEMELLEKIIQPTLGLITNLGPAHDEGFKNLEQKLREKSKLFIHCNTIFYCKDHDLIHQYLNAQFPQKLFCWSTKDNRADLYISKIEKKKEITEIKTCFLNQSITFSIPFTDEASIENVMHILLVALYFKLEVEDIQNHLISLRKVSMRLELKQGINSCYLIDDSYNNDLAGLEMAIDFLSQQNQRPKKALILSDLLESGVREDELYQSIAQLIHQKGISRLIGVGPVISKYSNFFKIGSTFFPDTQHLLENLKHQEFQNEVILVKGARVFAFENIIAALQQKIHGTVLEINLDALSNNLNFYRSRLKPLTKVMVMVKAFAYGSGSQEVANMLQFHRVDYLAVAYPDEGVELRQNGVTLPIMVMNPSPEAFEKIIQYKLEPEIYSPFILSRLQAFLKDTSLKIRIHIELETGMKRLGFEEDQLIDLMTTLSENKNIEVASIFSHLAGSDEAEHNEFSEIQINKFETLSRQIEERLGYKVIKHILNSPGIIRFPHAQFDMVRLGIGLYGVEVNEQFQDKLQPISKLKTTVSQVKHVGKGDTIGYGRRGITARDTTIATIAIGYADGFSRSFSQGKGKVMINGNLVSVIGNVCMDMAMVDVTGLEVAEGDEVIIFGPELPISQIAKWIDTIPYEILTNISERVKRVYYTE